jgi:hypothetical protein
MLFREIISRAGLLVMNIGQVKPSGTVLACIRELSGLYLTLGTGCFQNYSVAFLFSSRQTLVQYHELGIPLYHLQYFTVHCK